ncbi:MAG TPA: hypothetical protein VMS08_02755, partial [Candidatus Saccharimonadia bacterium]|nr:hypothetical protein [Candidatus Saccharimonadia bacterium]
MGHEVAPVRNNWLRRQYFGHLLRTEQSWLLALLGNSEDVAPATGSETEFGVFQNDPLLPAHAAGQSVVAELQRLFPGQATPELVRANGEVLTVEQPLANGTPFGSTLADLTRKLGAAQNAAQRHGARIGLVGFPGTWGLAYNGGMRGLLVPMKRYETYVKRMPSWDLTIPGIDGPIHVHAETVGGVGGCLAFQFTLDVPETQLHRFYDAASVWAGLHRALMPNTPFAFGRESRMHDSRWDVFTTGTRFDNRYRTFVGPTWTHSPQGVMEAIFGQVGRRSVFLDASRK